MNRTFARVCSLLVSMFAAVAAMASQETEIVVGAGVVNGSLAPQRTAWYGWSASANAGYCVTLNTTAGNGDLYLLDAAFAQKSSSVNAGLAQDKIWFGQAAAGRLHAGVYGNSTLTSTYSVQVVASPVITSISPTSGQAGAIVTLSGFGFGATRGASVVKFGAVNAVSYPLWSNTSVQAVVPSGVSGAISITAVVNAITSNAVNFQAAAGISSDTTMWRFNLGRTSDYPGGPATFPLTEKWNVNASAGRSPVIAGTTAYIAFGNQLRAYDASTGAQRWSWAPPAAEPNAIVYDPAVGSNGLVYFVISHDSSSGKRAKVYAINASTGVAVWGYDAGLQVAHMGTPAVANGIVYAGFYDGRVLALDAANGALRWTFSSGGARFEASPAIANNTVYIPSTSVTYALDASSGAVRWSVSMPGWTQSSPAVSGNTVYVGSNNGVMYAFDAATGATRWTYGTGAWVNAWLSSPAISGNTLFVGTGSNLNKVIALDATTGALKWSYTAAGGTYGSSPAVSNGTVYIESFDSKLLALDATTGTLKWSYAFGGFAGASSPSIANNRVYVVGYDPGGLQKLFSFGP